MGIDSFIRRSDVRQRFVNEFPKPRVSHKKEILAPRLTNSAQKLGKAFDYLLRFYIKHLNPQSVEIKWTAEHMVDHFKEVSEPYKSNPISITINHRLQTIITEARQIYSTFLKKSPLKVGDELIDSAILLAKIDQLGYINPKAGFPKGLWLIKDEDKKDLKNLISIVDPALFKTTETCILNPSFGETPVFRRASGDLVIGDALIDIKTVIDSKFDRRYFNELMTYYTLYRIGGINGLPPEKKIKRVGVYFSRYGHLVLLDLENIVNEDRFPKFVEWFKENASI